MRMRNPKYKDEVINNCDFLISDNSLSENCLKKYNLNLYLISFDEQL